MFRAVAVLALLLLLGSNALIALLTSAPAQAATCDDNWTGPSSGGNWATGPWDNGTPTSTTHACINGADVTISDVSVTGELTMSGGSLTMSGGSLELADTSVASTINALNMSGGIIQADDGAASLTLNLTGNSTWSSGTIQGTGLAGGAAVPGAIPAVPGDPDSVIVVPHGSTLTVSGPGAQDSSGVPQVGLGTGLQIDGTLDLNVGFFCVSGDGLTNEADGTFDMDGSALGTFDCNLGNSAPVTNDGTMSVTAPGSPTNPEISNNFTNNGTLAVATTLNLNGNTSMSATSIFEPSLAATATGFLNLQGGVEGVGGMIQPVLAPEFVPVVGQQFVVITCDGTCTGSYPPTQDGFTVFQNGGEVVLEAEPTGSVSPNPVSFPDTQVGSSVSETATLQNTGSAALTVTSTAVSSGPFSVPDSSNTCTVGLVLNPGNTCSVLIDFTPTSAGLVTGTVTFTDDGTNSPQVAQLAGTGLTMPEASVTPSTASFPDTFVGTTSTAIPVMVSSTGSAPLVITTPVGFALTGPDAGDFSIGTNGCFGSGGLFPGQFCTIDVLFSPTAMGSRTATLQVFDNASDSPQTVQLTGNGIEPLVSFSPDPLPFGTSPVGVPVGPLTVTATNIGNASLTLSPTTIGGANPADFSIVNDGCITGEGAIAPGGTCTVQVTFTAQAPGPRSAFLTFTDNALDSPQQVTMTGTGGQAGIGFSPNPLAFPNTPVGTSSGPLLETVTNTGSAPLTVAPSLSGSSDFSLASNNCPATVSPGATCTIGITFTPTSAAPEAATLTLTDNAPGSPQTVPVTGLGTAPGFASSPNPLTFPPTAVGSSVGPLVETVTNTGLAPLIVSSATIGGANPGDFTVASDTCTIPTGVPGGGTCTVGITFTPAAISARTATLLVADNAAGSPQGVTLNGTSTQPGIAFAPNPLAFPATPLTTSSGPLTETVTNTGTAPLAITSVAPGGADPGDFAIGTDSCAGAQIAPGGTCSVQVTFTPTLAGARTASLVFTDTAPASPQTVVLTGTGTAPAVTFSPNPIAFPATPVGTPAAPLTETLTNSGTAPLIVSAVALGGANAADFGLGSNSCTGATVAVGGTCSVAVSFTPAAAGPLSASLSVTDNATPSPQAVPVTGSGTVPGTAFSPDPVAFPATPVATAAAPLAETLTNSGLAPLTVIGVSLGGTNAADFGLASNSCNGATVAPGGSCTLIVTFTPGAAGARAATLSFTDNATPSPQAVGLSGTGTVPGASASPNPLSFPATTVGASSGPLVATLTSAGTAPLSVASVAVGGADAAEFAVTTDSCSGATLAAGASCSVGITFSPAAVGARNASLSFADNATGSPQSIALAGTGSAVPLASVSLTPNPLSFPATLVGAAAAPQAVTLANTGAAPLAVASVALSGPDQGDFLVASNSCNGASLAPGASCSLVVEFIPAAGGARTAALVATDNAPGGSQSVAVTGTGTVPLVVESITRPLSPSPSPAGSPPAPSPSPPTVRALTLTRSSPSPATPSSAAPPPPAASPSPGPSPLAVGVPTTAPPAQPKQPANFTALSLLGLPYGPPGTGLNTSGHHYPAGCTTAYFFFDGVRIGSDPVNSAGQATGLALSVPGDAKPGDDTVTSSCSSSGGPVLYSTVFRVTPGLHRSSFLTSLNPPGNVARSLKSILLTAAATVLMLILLAFPSQVFNATLQEHYEEVRRWFHLKRPMSEVVQQVNQRVLFPIMLAVGGVLFALIAPDFGFNLSTLALALGLSIAVAVVTVGFAIPTYLFFLGEYHDRGKILVMPGSIIVGAVCVVLSRLAHFEPGYLYGLLAIFVFHHESTERNDGRLAAVSALLVLGLAILCWVFRLPLTGLNERHPSFLALVGESALSGAFVLGVESVIVGLLPMKFLDGSRIKSWSKLAWAGLFALGIFVAIQVLLQPGSGYVGHATTAGKLTVLSLYVAFGLFSFGFWAYFRYRKPKAGDEELDTEGDYEVR